MAHPGFSLEHTETALLGHAGLVRDMHLALVSPIRCLSCCVVILPGDLVVRRKSAISTGYAVFCDDCVDRALEIFYSGCESCLNNTNDMGQSADPMFRDAVNRYEPIRHNYDNLFLGDYLRP